MDKLFVEFTYPINEPGKFKYESNIKSESLADIVADFIRSQTGAGVDNSPANEKDDVYTIRLTLDLSDDSFGCSHNCGNKGLRDGILMDILNRLPN